MYWRQVFHSCLLKSQQHIQAREFPPQVPSRYFRDCSNMKVSDSVSSQELLPSSACFV